MNKIISPIQSKELRDKLTHALADRFLNTPISKSTPMLVRIMADLMKIHKELFDKVDEYNKLVEIKKGDKGDSVKGDPGKDGHTPTREELLSLIEPLIPEVKDGETPSEEYLLSLIRMVMPEVKNGETPTDEKLVSLMKTLIPKIETKDLVITDEHIEKITEKVSKKIKPVKMERQEVDIDNLLNLIAKRPKGKRLNLDFVDGLDQTIQSLSSQITKKGYLHGGGDTVLAGAGVSITKNTNGNKIISASASPVSLTGTINGSNVTFTVATTPNIIFSDGIAYRKNKGWTISGLTVTMAIAPSYDIFYL